MVQGIYFIKLAKVGVLPSDQEHPHRHSKIPPSETPKIENLGTGSRVGGASKSLCSKALVRVFAIRVYEQRVLENNLDSGNLRRSVLGRFRI
jgi:hypothetical protein